MSFKYAYFLELWKWSYLLNELQKIMHIGKPKNMYDCMTCGNIMYARPNKNSCDTVCRGRAVASATRQNDGFDNGERLSKGQEMRRLLESTLYMRLKASELDCKPS